MPNANYVPVSGVVQSIAPVQTQCCQQFVGVQTRSGINNFIILPDTYVVNSVHLAPGMPVVMFYDANRPVPLIYPPQYQAVVVTQNLYGGRFALDYFDSNLVSSDNTLKLNIAPTTQILTSNGQDFNCSLSGQLLLVYYKQTTRSIPPQTTPMKIIVMC